MLIQRTLIWGTTLGLSIFSAAHAEECAKLTRMKLDHATLTSVAVVPGGAATKGPAGEEIPAAKTDYCRIQVVAKPTTDSDIRFELWVPSGGAWNGKFEQVGNGGFAGTIPYRSMATVLSLGYAVAGTDDGHQSSGGSDARWALNHPEKIKDYGWRAIQQTTLASKQILRKLTSKSPSKSYFVGCSDGGREALMMAQRFPTYFDGIVAGAPAYAMTRLMTESALRTAKIRGDTGHLSSPQLALLQRQALQSCGNGARYLKDPRQCHVDLAALKCAGAGADTCLTDAQINTARVLYAQEVDPVSGDPLYGAMPGAEGVAGGWDRWLAGTDDQASAAMVKYGWNYFAYMVRNDPDLDLSTLSEADLARAEHEYAPIMDSRDADLSAFKSHGGKLIHYHGWNDPAIPPGFSLEYRQRMAAKTGGVNEFYRLYLVPGMLHCGGGDAPTVVNWQGALESWVEKNQPPQELVATDGNGATQTLQPFQ